MSLYKEATKLDVRIKDAWAIEKFYKQLELLKTRSEKLVTCQKSVNMSSRPSSLMQKKYKL